MIELLAQATQPSVSDAAETIKNSEAFSPTFWGMFVLSMALAVLCVLMHNQVVRFLWKKVHLHGSLALRWSMVITVLTLMLAHLAQIVLFGVTFYLLAEQFGIGSVDGAEALIRDYFYFSGVAYTTVGFGDLTPKDALRPVAAAESLIGFVMITWSASFTFLQMQRSWSEDEQEQADEEEADDA